MSGGLFEKNSAKPTAEVPVSNSVAKAANHVKTQLWPETLTDARSSTAQSSLENPLSRIRRLLRPTGFLVAVLGPDGVGKSTLIEDLIRTIGPSFPRHRVFHWRPRSLWKRKPTGPVIDPHGQTEHPVWLSMARIFAHLLDYWFGYWVAIRPLLIRSGLVVFDRYFDDVLIDPKRYRYGGPQWLPRVLGRLVPRPDLVLVLDAPVDVILSRKQEVTPDEIQRQRSAYLKWAEEFSPTCVLDASRPLPEVSADARRAVVQAWDSLTSSRLRAEQEGTETEEPLRKAPDSQAALLRNALDQFLGQGSWSSPAGDEKEASLPDATDFGDVLVVHFEGVKEGVHSNNGGRTHRFAILPSSKSPRLLLPLGDPETTLQGLQIYAPYAPAARMAKNLLAGAIQWNWQGLGCDRVSVTSHGPLPLENLIREVTGETRPVFALLVGTPGLYHKMTIQVMRPGGEILGFLKLPLSRPAVDNIRHEAEMLRRLSEYVCLRPHLPQVLYAGKWGNGYILFQTGGPGREGPVEFGPLHEKFLEVLRSVHRVEKPGDALVEDVARHWREAEPLLDAELRELGEKALERASEDLAGLSVPCGIGHGDFAPWNTRTEDGRLFVHDWESAIWEAPVEWDRFHFQVQVSSLLGRTNGLAAHLERDPDERAIFLLYLLDSLCRTLKERAALEFEGVKFRKQLLASALGQPANKHGFDTPTVNHKMGIIPTSSATASLQLGSRAAGLSISRLTWAGKASVALLDQGLISGSNFVIGILLARWLTPTYYGAYALAFSVFLSIATFHNALLLEPMSVLGPSRHRNRLPDYLGELLWLHFGLIAALSFLFSLGLFFLGRSSGITGSAFWGASAAMPWILFFWLWRRAAYLTFKPWWAARSAAVYALVALTLLFLTARLHWLSPLTAFLLQAIAAFAASVLLIAAIRPQLCVPRLNASMRNVLKQHWEYGRWVVATGFAYWFSGGGGAYYVLVAAVLRMEDVAALRALENFAQPVSQFIAPISLLLLPWASARFADRGRAGLQRAIQEITLLFGAMATAYFVVLLVFGNRLIGLLYGGKYSSTAHLLPLIALPVVVSAVSQVPSIALRAMQKPREVFIGYSASALATLLFGLAFTYCWGLTGAILGILTSSLAFCIVINLRYRARLRKALPNVIRNCDSSARS